MSSLAMQLESGKDRKLFGWKQLVQFFPVVLPAVLGGFLLLGMAAGCKNKPTSAASADNSAAAETIRIACPSESTVSLINRFGRLWSSRAGQRIEVLRYQPQKGPDPSDHCDLWVIDPAQMPFYASRGELLMVPGEFLAPGGSYAWDTLLPLFRDKLLIWDKKAYALPLLEEPLFCFYRTDLIDDPARAKSFKESYRHQLKPPETWEDYLEVAEFFNQQSRPGIDRPCFSLPPLPADDRSLDWEYYCLAAPFARRAAGDDDAGSAADGSLFSFHYDLKDGAIRINTPGFVHALEVMQKLQKCRPAGRAVDPPAAFQRGEAVLCLAPPTWITRFDEDERVRGKFAFRTIPATQLVFDFYTGRPAELTGTNYVPYLGAGGAIMVVPCSSAQSQDAFALASFLSDPRTSQEIVIEPAWGGGAYRREHLENRVGWQAFELGARGSEILVDCIRRTVAYNQIKNPVVRLRIPAQESHMQAKDAEIHLALLQGKSAKQALDAAASRWRELDASVPPEQGILNYRLSLSLTR
jgi:multiple sugar transport system substrate-binding protein